ncbi:AsnC family protein [Candidatus Woesearchaeota archaeon]|nr:AsnC family protein [Candidatus Woesearchaeota archaeon]
MKKSNIPDEKDKKILSILHLNSRTPLAKIGGEVSLSKDAVE